MTGPGRPQPSGEAVLAVVRIGLLLGVLGFGAVTWFVHRDPSRQPSNPASLDTLRQVMIGAWVLVIVALIALRPRLGRLSGGARRSFLIMMWTVGEAAALIGGVHYFLSGDVRSFLGGLLVMLGSFVLYPIRSE